MIIDEHNSLKIEGSVPRAVKLYQETKDVYAVKEALGHATVGITEIYLAGMGFALEKGVSEYHPP